MSNMNSILEGIHDLFEEEKKKREIFFIYATESFRNCQRGRKTKEALIFQLCSRIARYRIPD